METYYKAFINFKQDDWAWLLPIVEFVYNNVKNASTDLTSFELNCGYRLWIFYKKTLISAQS